MIKKFIPIVFAGALVMSCEKSTCIKCNATYVNETEEHTDEWCEDSVTISDLETHYQGLETTGLDL